MSTSDCYIDMGTKLDVPEYHLFRIDLIEHIFLSELTITNRIGAALIKSLFL